MTENEDVQLPTQTIAEIVQQQRDIVACLGLMLKALYSLDEKVNKLHAAIDQLDLRTVSLIRFGDSSKWQGGIID
jgi:hypothetical protein